MGTVEPLTPVSIEAKITREINDIYYGQKAFAAKRDALTEAEILLKRARIVAAASEHCPRPSRGAVTVAERDAWIDAECFQEWEQLTRAQSALDIATSALRVQRDILSGLQSLARSVDTAYRNAA